jgi:ubiquinone/menaquinone biosynthesis C-methylase UbiE
MNDTLRWYNKLSAIHDLLSFRDWPYRHARQQAVKRLALRPGDVVIDLFCGTGVNFELILPPIGKTGKLIGVDGSPGMLARAQKRVQRNQRQTDQATLLEKDLLQVEPGFLADVLPQNAVPKVLITLALGVFSNYEDVFNRIYAAMPEGTRFAILEGYCKEGARGAWLLNFIGHSDCRRRVWEPVQALTADYHEAWYPTRFMYIQGSLVVASGVKG